MRPATFSVRPAPELGAGVHVFEIDCEHGVTTGTGLLPPGKDGFDERQKRLITAHLVQRHYEAERCKCTTRLRRLYSREGSN